MDAGGSTNSTPKRIEYQRWRDSRHGYDDEDAWRAAKPDGILRAEFELALMERFNYPSLKALRKESSEILLLLEAESYGHKADEREEIAEMRRRIDQQTQMTGDYQYG